MKERFKYIPSIVMLMAGFVACIVTMICEYEIVEALSVILGVLIIFYIIGIVIKALFNRFLINEETIEENSEETESDETEEQSEDIDEAEADEIEEDNV